MQMPNLIEAWIRFSENKWKWVNKLQAHKYIGSSVGAKLLW